MLHRVLDYHLSTLYFRALQKHIPYDVGAAGMLVHKKLKDQKRKIYVVVSFSTEIVFLEHLTDRVL
jgi:hypothetical protein